jgi:hypothetical protein
MEEINRNLELKLAQTLEALAISQAELKDAHNTIDDLHDALDGMHGDSRFAFTGRFKESTLEALMTNFIAEYQNEIESWVSGPQLSPAERRRLLGASQRRYGFIDEVSDVMSTNPRFIPSNVDEQEFKDEIRKFELIRNFNITLQQVLRITQDIQLVMGDSLYRQALSYYGSVRDAALRRVEGAQVLFNRLREFFRNIHRRRTTDEPTEAEALRDARALLHGRKDGEIIIRNESPHLAGGERTVIDETL